MQQQSQHKNPWRRIGHTGIVLLCSGILYGACNKADEFYETLEGIPELDNSQQFAYRTAYTVGDTMVLYGRLHPTEGLTVQIGDAPAPLVDHGTDSFAIPGQPRRHALDKVRVLITENMGAGPNRPVTVTLGNYSINGAPIEIFSRNGGGYLRDSVNLGLYYSMLYRSLFFHHTGGKGSVYYYGNNKIECLQKGATVSTLLTAAGMKDENGLFVIQTMLAGSVDPSEKHVWFSAITTDTTAAGATNTIYRLCRYDIAAQQLVTVNRTLIPKDVQAMRPAHYMPFEGLVGTAKIPGATGLYADGSGGLYLRLDGNYAICRMQANGALKYAYKNAAGALPGIWDTVANSAATLRIRELPGTETTDALDNIRIAPDDKLLYTFPSTYLLPSAVRMLDLDATIPLAQLSRPNMTGTQTTTVVTGSFSGLTGVNYSLLPVFWGYLPLSGERLVQMNYQESEAPAWTVLDFGKGRADYYAPGRCETSVFKLRSTDLLLNYDEEGHLYMTANDGAQVVKTVVK